MFRKGFRFAAKGVGIVGVGTACLFVPPIEQLPNSLGHYRVLCEGFGRLFRCVGVGLHTMYEFNMCLPSNATEEQWNESHQRTANRLTSLAERNGGVFIKIGQNFAAQNHLLHPIYCKTMKKLQDSVMNRPISEVKAVLERELGQPVDEVFEDFNDTAIAAASLAQVHTAKLKETKEKVAVKVQYIDIHQRYDGDFAVVLLMLNLAGMIFPGYDFGKLVKESDKTMRAELYFDAEAASMERCHEDLQKEFGDNVICPRVIKKYSSEKVMVTEFIDGVRADDVEGMKKRGIDPRDVGRLLSDTFAYQLFVTGFVHADPHSSNVLVRRHPSAGLDGTNSCKPQCVLLDHGLTFELTESERKDLAEVWTCCVTHDDDNLRAVMRKLGLNGDDDELYRVFGSIYLQFPYDFYDPNKRVAQADHVELMREGANKTMPMVTEMLEKLPQSFVMSLRNISIYRAVHKTMGNPISRTSRMLRYSIVTAREDKLGWFSIRWAMMQLWFNELKGFIMMKLMDYYYPNMSKEIDEMFLVG